MDKMMKNTPEVPALPRSEEKLKPVSPSSKGGKAEQQGKFIVDANSEKQHRLAFPSMSCGRNTNNPGY